MSFDNRIGEGKYVITVDNQGAIQQLQKFEQSAKKTGDTTAASFKTGLASAVSLGSGLAGLYNQYDNLEKIQLRIRKSSLEVSRAQEEVNKLAKEGKTGTLDYQQALERLAISQERLDMLNGDLKQSQLGVSLSFAQTALSLPAAINGLKGLTSASQVLSVVTSKWTIIALAAIAAYEGIAQAIKITTGADYTLTTATGKLMDSMMGSNKIVSEGTTEFKAYGEEIKMVGINASDTASSFGDLNKQMDHTISMLKKNEISARLSDVQAQMADSMFFMGSLKYTVESLKEAGVEGFIQEHIKDTRTINNINKVKSAVISLYSIISGRAIPKDALGPNITESTGLGFIQLGAIRRNDWNPTAYSEYQRGRFVDYSRASRGGISFLGGQANSLKANYSGLGGVTMSGIKSQQLTSGLKTVRKGAKHGGAKLGWGVQEVQNSWTKAIQGFALTAKEYRDLGFDITIPSFPFEALVGRTKSPSNEFLQLAHTQALDLYQKSKREYDRQIEAANAAIEARLMGLVSRSGLSRSQVVSMQSTQQGTDDLYGIIDYRERLARASTGTG